MKLWQRKASKSSDTAPNKFGQWLFYLIAASGVIISLLLGYAFVQQSHTNLGHIIQLHAEHVADDITIQFEPRISALKHMAKHLQADEHPTHDSWLENASEFLNNYPGFETMAYLDPSLTVQWIAPENNPSFETLIANFIAKSGTKLRNTLQNPTIWLSQSVSFQEGNGVFIVTPVISPTQGASGLLISFVNLKALFQLQFVSPNYSTTIADDTQKILQFEASPASHTIPPAQTTLHLYGTDWRITVEASKILVSSMNHYLTFTTSLLGISIVILIVIVTRLAMLAKQRGQSLAITQEELSREIVERKQAEESTQKLEKALLQGQKLQAIGTLAGGIAHDFNNILYAITGFVEMAQDDVPKDSLVFHNLGKVLEASHRGQELISHILAFSRRQQHAYKPIPLKSTIESVLALLKPTIPSSVLIKFSALVPGECQIMGDQTQMHQVIVNIINNAVDAMDGEGKITIQLSRVETNSEILQLLPNASKRYYQIDFTDTGHGMSQATIERIFEPFYTTKEVGKGTGLGLSTAHAIVKNHEGEVLVISEMGIGTTFSLFFPEYTAQDDKER